MAVNMTAHLAPIQTAIDKILRSSNIIESQQHRIEDLTTKTANSKAKFLNSRVMYTT